MDGKNKMKTADGFDDAIIGIGQRCGQEDLVVYDQEKCVDILAKDMPREDAIEYFEFNVLGSWVGEDTPIFVYKPSEEL